MQAYLGDAVTVRVGRRPALYDYGWGGVAAVASAIAPDGTTQPLVTQLVGREWATTIVVTQVGAWRVRWVLTASGGTETRYSEVDVVPAPGPVTVATWAPSLDTIGGLLSARLGARAPSATTNPTDVQVLALLDLVQREIVKAVERPLETQHVEYARDTAALGVAAYVENGAYPEQNELLDTQGHGEFLRRRYQEHLEQLRADVRGTHIG